MLSFGPSFAAPFPISFAVVGTAPVAAAYSPVTHAYYVANNASNDVSVVIGAGAQNTRADKGSFSPRIGAATELLRIPVGRGPAGIAVHPKTGVVFISNQGSDSVTVIAGSSASVLATMTSGASPWGLAVEPDLNRLCVADFGSEQVDVFDTTNRTLVAHVPVPGGPIGVAAANGFCYVTSFYAGTVSKIDLKSLSVVAGGLSVPGIIAANPQGISLTPDGSTLFVANTGNDSVSKINPVNLGVLQVTALVPGARPVGVSASASTAYVSEYGRDKLATVSTVTGIATELLAGVRPNGVATGGTPECALVANSGSETAGLYCDQPL
ncbi:MAG: hypothetical protein NVSMB57_08770 [Actinomycetota bacterium]